MHATSSPKFVWQQHLPKKHFHWPEVVKVSQIVKKNEHYNKRERKVEEEQETGPKNEQANILSRNHKHIYLCNLISMIQV